VRFLQQKVFEEGPTAVVLIEEREEYRGIEAKKI
jgi:hypothetical protein